MVENELLHRRESIVLATIEVIHEFGIHSLSTREVAKRVGISEPAIFKHFKTKSDLLLAVLEHFSHYDSDVIQSIQTKIQKPTEAIYSYVDIYAAYYENYPAITAITQIYDVLRHDPKLSGKIESILFTRTEFITTMVRQSQENGEISADIESENLAVAIMGLNREWCLNWRMRGYSFSLREKMLDTMNMLLEAFKLK